MKKSATFTAVILFVVMAVAFHLSPDLVINSSQAPTYYATNTDNGFETLQWEPMNGPPGCSVRWLTLDPQNAETLYLGTYRGLYISQNRGTEWTLIPETDNKMITSIAVTGHGVFFVARDRTAYRYLPTNGSVTIVRGEADIVFTDGLGIVRSAENTVYVINPDFDNSGGFHNENDWGFCIEHWNFSADAAPLVDVDESSIINILDLILEISCFELNP